MRGDVAWDDDELETRVFIKAESESFEIPSAAVRPLARGTAPTPNIMIGELTAPVGRYSIPSLADMLEPEAGANATLAIPRQRGIKPLHVALASACALLGITVGALVALSGRSVDVPATISVPVSHPIVAPIEPAPAPVAAAAPVLVTLHVESSPPGATVMLVGDAGATTVIGTTPVDADVDPGRDYDVLIKLADRAPRLEHVAASSNHRVAVAFDEAPAAPAHHHRAAAPAVSENLAKGSLRITAKPPCSIAIDGRPTGMSTPQAAISLAAGHHSITLTNAEQGISLTKDVTIEADQSTSLIQNFLD
jgi:hypothetical protein